MRILFLTHAFNSLTQRLYTELTTAGHDVSIEFDINDTVTGEAVKLWRPDLIIAPYLKRPIPEAIWRKHVCLIVHPGIPGDRGPSALDWAILNGETTWGVTVLQADAELDAGPIWASRTFPMRFAPKSSIYRHEVTEAAVAAIFEALDRYEFGIYTPVSAPTCDPSRRGRWRPFMKQAERRIDWHNDDTETVLRKLFASDGSPGVETTLCGMTVRLFAARTEAQLRGRPGELLARSDDAVCIATRDGAVWIGRLKAVVAGKQTLKLPATQVLSGHIDGLPQAAPQFDSWQVADCLQDIRYFEKGPVGYLYFDFHNGAMSTEQCERLRDAYCRARQRPTRVIVLMGGDDFWSNGLHLNVIEAARSPADESWRNINAMDDLCHEIITTESHVTVAAVRGNAGAGGVFLALAADRIYAPASAIFNPHYKNMGNLYGSEYWTYLLPRRVGEAAANRIVNNRLPLSAEHAAALGLIDTCIYGNAADFNDQLQSQIDELACDDGYNQILQLKCKARAKDESKRPLQDYRAAELRQMKLDFYGFDPSYHVARYKFVYRVPHAWTPLHLAHHRRLAQRRQAGSARPVRAAVVE